MQFERPERILSVNVIEQHSVIYNANDVHLTFMNFLDYANQEVNLGIGSMAIKNYVSSSHSSIALETLYHRFPQDEWFYVYNDGFIR